MPNSFALPLRYSWHGKRYVGAAHGLAGIVMVLLQAHEVRLRTDTTAIAVCVPRVPRIAGAVIGRALAVSTLDGPRRVRPASQIRDGEGGARVESLAECVQGTVVVS